jgi:hypothetical protein
MGRTGNADLKTLQVLDKAGQLSKGLFRSGLTLMDPGWDYSKPSLAECPFPCHPYYDLKAWQWLTENIDQLKGNILFWNIGRMN